MLTSTMAEACSTKNNGSLSVSQVAFTNIASVNLAQHPTLRSHPSPIRHGCRELVDGRCWPICHITWLKRVMVTQNLMARRKVLQRSSALYSSDSDTDSS